MEAIALVVISGVVGGAAFAIYLFKTGRALPDEKSAEVFDRQPLSVVNISRVQVAGIGGFGLVVVAAAVAVAVPGIGVTMALALVLGAALAAVIILRRRTSGPISSSSQRPGANTVLSIDGPAQSEREDAKPRATDRHIRRTAPAAPAI